MNYNTTYPYKVYDLPYDVESLTEVIDKRTLIIHHDKIYVKYIEKLNYLVKNNPSLMAYTIEELLFNPYLINPNILLEYLHTAGGVYNHELYFNNLCKTKKEMKPLLKEKVINTFSSINNFYKHIVTLSTSPINYSWIIVGIDKRKNLTVIGLKDNDTCIVLDIYPLIVIDIVEHSYFLKYHNHKDQYVKNIFNIIDYDVVEERLCNILNHNHP